MLFAVVQMEGWTETTARNTSRLRQSAICQLSRAPGSCRALPERKKQCSGSAAVICNCRTKIRAFACLCNTKVETTTLKHICSLADLSDTSTLPRPARPEAGPTAPSCTTTLIHYIHRQRHLCIHHKQSQSYERLCTLELCWRSACGLKQYNPALVPHQHPVTANSSLQGPSASHLHLPDVLWSREGP